MEKAKELFGMKTKEDKQLDQEYEREGISRPSDRPGQRAVNEPIQEPERTKIESMGTRPDEPTGYTRQPPLGMAGQTGEPESFVNVEQHHRPDVEYSGYTNEPISQSGTDKTRLSEAVGTFPTEQRDRPLAGDLTQTQYNKPVEKVEKVETQRPIVEGNMQNKTSEKHNVTEKSTNEYVKAGVQPQTQHLAGSIKPIGSDREWR